MSEPILDVVKLKKSYGRQPALNSVELQVRAGELFGLLGPNGAGKTTLMSILAGLQDADSGRVTMFGKEVNRAARDFRHLVGIATQDLAVYPELTAEENLRFFGRLYGMQGDHLESRIQELLAKVGLTDKAQQRAGTYSGGMKRRLNLAVAVVHGPKLLLLDEPTTGVDPQSRNHIFDLIRELNHAGMTMIYTSHYMEEVQSLCPRIAILDHGSILACDTLPALLGRLESQIEIEFAAPPDDLLPQVAKLPGVVGCSADGNRLMVQTADAPALLPRLITLVSTQQRVMTRMNVLTPTLEKVFLHLTGRALRD